MKARPVAERFAEKWIPEPNSGCWLWTAAVNQDGYGRILAHGRTNCSASRISWEIHRGAIPEGKEVCHTCDTPSCVNPDHLFLGSHGDNIRDCVRKGRREYPLSGMVWSTVRTQKNPSQSPTCRNGHDRSKFLYITPLGATSCTECRRQAVRRWYNKKRRPN